MATLRQRARSFLGPVLWQGLLALAGVNQDETAPLVKSLACGEESWLRKTTWDGNELRQQGLVCIKGRKVLGLFREDLDVHLPASWVCGTAGSLSTDGLPSARTSDLCLWSELE